MSARGSPSADSDGERARRRAASDAPEAAIGGEEDGGRRGVGADALLHRRRRRQRERAPASARARSRRRRGLTSSHCAFSPRPRTAPPIVRMSDRAPTATRATRPSRAPRPRAPPRSSGCTEMRATAGATTSPAPPPSARRGGGGRGAPAVAQLAVRVTADRARRRRRDGERRRRTRLDARDAGRAQLGGAPRPRLRGAVCRDRAARTSSRRRRAPPPSPRRARRGAASARRRTPLQDAQTVHPAERPRRRRGALAAAPRRRRRHDHVDVARRVDRQCMLGAGRDDAGARDGSESGAAFAATAVQNGGSADASGERARQHNSSPAIVLVSATPDVAANWRTAASEQRRRRVVARARRREARTAGAAAAPERAEPPRWRAQRARPCGASPPSTTRLLRSQQARAVQKRQDRT